MIACGLLVVCLVEFLGWLVYALLESWRVVLRDDAGAEGVYRTYEYKFGEGFLARAEYRRDWSNVPFFLTNKPGVLSPNQPTLTTGLVWWYGGSRALVAGDMSQVRANRRSFDCDSRDETARAFAQDDTFFASIGDGSSYLRIWPDGILSCSPSPCTFSLHFLLHFILHHFLYSFTTRNSEWGVCCSDPTMRRD
jgi:hypothetical protein